MNSYRLVYNCVLEDPQLSTLWTKLENAQDVEQCHRIAQQIKNITEQLENKQVCTGWCVGLYRMVCWSVQDGVLVCTGWCVCLYRVVCWSVQDGVLACTRWCVGLSRWCVGLSRWCVGLYRVVCWSVQDGVLACTRWCVGLYKMVCWSVQDDVICFMYTHTLVCIVCTFPLKDQVTLVNSTMLPAHTFTNLNFVSS